MESTPVKAKALKVITWPFLAIINLVLLVILFPVGLVYGAVYSCLHRPANAHMPRKYMPPVQVYLNHFQRLHPDLMARISRHAVRDTEGWIQRELEMWPHSGKIGFMATVANHESCPAAIFFAGLEHAGWSRQVIWELLRDQVEGAELVTEEEKAAFALVMSAMCDHQITELAMSIIRWCSEHGLLNKEKIVILPETDVERGENVIEASPDSLSWILEGGKIVRPPRLVRNHKSILLLMINLEAEFNTVWEMKSTTEATMPGYWQNLELPDELLE
ncbi:hypothetical protein BJX64DRAFT_292411 [Aspergillus heterothallicus]